MDLAEIRKKAQLEKNAAQTASSPERSHPQTANADDLPIPWEDSAVNTAPVDSGASVPWQEAEKLPIAFDPLAILLAGRQASACPSAGHSELAADESPAGQDSAKYIRFRLDAETYAVNLMDIKEIIKPRVITEVPHAPDFLLGIISLRGIIVPVIDMRARLGFSKAIPAARQRIIIVKKKDGCCGLLVDEVFEVVTLAQQPIEGPPTVLDGTDREFITGIGRHGDQMCILVDLEKILDVSLQ
jgi:purine-binding chemotaxis protein CheW